MPIAELNEDILQVIMTLAVDGCHQRTDSDSQLDEDSPCFDTSGRDALVTLTRLSHVNFRWRSLALLSCALWAGNIRITPNMSATLLEDVLIRTAEQPLHLSVIDLPPRHPLWPRALELFKRCLTLRCQLKQYPHFMGIITTTPAPILQECAIFCEAPSQITTLWKPLFAGLAPALRRLRLIRTCGNGLPGPGLLAIGGIQRLTHLELAFPTDAVEHTSAVSPFVGTVSPILLPHIDDLKLTGNPLTLANFLEAVALPALSSISALYVFSPDPILEAMALIWDPLFRHFPSVDFPDFKIHSSEGDFKFDMRHANGQRLALRFDDRKLQGAVDEESTEFLLPFIHIPSHHLNRSQILHGLAWMQLVATPEYVTSVRTVTVSASSPNSTFPYHVHFLLSGMVVAETLRFDDCASAYHPDWYDLLRDKTGPFGHSPLPNISTISLPIESLGRMLSNVGLRDLLWDRHDDWPVSRLHFYTPSRGVPDSTWSFTVLKEISQALPAMISAEVA